MDNCLDFFNKKKHTIELEIGFLNPAKKLKDDSGHQSSISRCLNTVGFQLYLISILYSC